MDYETIIYEVEDNILTMTLNRPEKLNAFNQTMMEEMIDAFDKADEDDDVKAIIVTGAGRGFCAGADLSGGSGTFDQETGTRPTGLRRDGGGLPAQPRCLRHAPADTRLRREPADRVERYAQRSAAEPPRRDHARAGDHRLSASTRNVSRGPASHAGSRPFSFEASATLAR